MAGVGTVGDSIGATAAESSITTTPIFPTAGPSSTAMAFSPVETMSTAGKDVVMAGVKLLVDLPVRMQGQVCIPAPSAALTMGVSREATHRAGRVVLAASAGEDSVAVVFTAAVAADKLLEVIQL
jgi:hypothetical protein